MEDNLDFSRKVVILQKTSGDYLTCQADPHLSSFHHLDLPAFQQLQQILVNPILPPKKLLFITIFVVNLFLIIFFIKVRLSFHHLPTLLKQLDAKHNADHCQQ